MNTPVAVLLGRKGCAVETVAASFLVADAVRVMNEKKIGCVVVMEENRLAGIFTERDVLTRIVGAGRDPARTLVAEVMTSDVETIGPDVTVGQVVELFTTKRCRHLPVVLGGELQGLISIGDASRWLADVHRAEAEQLRQYISGGYPT